MPKGSPSPPAFPDSRGGFLGECGSIMGQSPDRPWIPGETTPQALPSRGTTHKSPAISLAASGYPQKSPVTAVARERETLAQPGTFKELAAISPQSPPDLQWLHPRGLPHSPPPQSPVRMGPFEISCVAQQLHVVHSASEVFGFPRHR